MIETSYAVSWKENVSQRCIFFSKITKSDRRLFRETHESN